MGEDVVLAAGAMIPRKRLPSHPGEMLLKEFDDSIAVAFKFKT